MNSKHYRVNYDDNVTDERNRLTYTPFIFLFSFLLSILLGKRHYFSTNKKKKIKIFLNQFKMYIENIQPCKAFRFFACPFFSVLLYLFFFLCCFSQTVFLLTKYFYFFFDFLVCPLKCTDTHWMLCMATATTKKPTDENKKQNTELRLAANSLKWWRKNQKYFYFFYFLTVKASYALFKKKISLFLCCNKMCVSYSIAIQLTNDTNWTVCYCIYTLPIVGNMKKMRHMESVLVECSVAVGGAW